VARVEKQEVVDWVTEILQPFGYSKHKRKKYVWWKDETGFTKYIELNHSNFGNYFHVEYAFDLHALEREKKGFHHSNQLNLHFFEKTGESGTEDNSNERLYELDSFDALFTADVKADTQRILSEGYSEEESIHDKLNGNSPYETAFDFDLPLDDTTRKELMREVIVQGVVIKLERLHNLDELKRELQTEDEKYFVSIVVQEFFGLE